MPGRSCIARHVIQRIENPRVLIQTASYDMASDVWQILNPKPQTLKPYKAQECGAVVLAAGLQAVVAQVEFESKS
jgi:hypothetical protein